MNTNFTYDLLDIVARDYFLSEFLRKQGWLHIIVLTLSFSSFFLTLKHIYRKINLQNINFFNRLLKKKINPITDHELKEFENNNSIIVGDFIDKNTTNRLSVNFNEKYVNELNRNLSFWPFISLITNIMQISASFCCLFDDGFAIGVAEILLGFSCFLTFITITHYIEYNPKYLIIFDTIKRALPNVSRYLLGVMPIFLGFIFFGKIIIV